MNQAFNPVFAFKKILGDEGAKRVSSELFCHPIIWELFSFENFFASAVSLFGPDLEKWTPKNIILNIDNLADQNNSATNLDQNDKYLCVLKEIKDISEIIKEITNNRKNNKPWENILQDLHLDVNNTYEISRKWMTVFWFFWRNKTKEMN